MKKLFPLILVAVLAFAGCNTASNVSGSTPASESAVTSSESSVSKSTEAPSSSEVEETPSSEAAESTESSAATEDPAGMTVVDAIEAEIKEMTANQYDGLEFSAAILERKAIIPGGSMKVNVTIKNTGDKIVSYEHGSQGFEVPTALYVYSKGLQTVPPEGNLGPMTMDMQTYLIEPGQELQLTYTLLAVETNPNFDTYAFEVYSGEDSAYIANLGFDELVERFPDIVIAKAGNYKGRAIFRYRVESIDEMTYAEAEFDINVTE